MKWKYWSEADWPLMKMLLQQHCFDQNIAVRPTSEADVSIIVKAAKDADMPISIRRWAQSQCENVAKK